MTFLVSIERKCHICDMIVLNKLALTQSEHISGHASCWGVSCFIQLTIENHEKITISSIKIRVETQTYKTSFK